MSKPKCMTAVAIDTYHQGERTVIETNFMLLSRDQ
jgi:hypothetical protein